MVVWTELRFKFARVAVPAILVSSLLVTGSGPASATKPGGGGGSGSTTTGNDVSYPQCGTTLPGAPAFGIVGVNDGLANTLNPCLGPSSTYPSYAQSELYWAVASSTGVTTQPKASLYVNTADPGNIYNGTLIADWPTSSLSIDPYGSCNTTTVTTSTGATATVGENSPACAWQYGYNRAAQDIAWLYSAATAINSQESSVNVSDSASSYTWWLDVETANTWQSGTSGQAMNVAVLQGMDHEISVGPIAVKVGAYSTSSQWNQITGGTTSTSDSLYGIPNWIPGARTLSGARSNCGLTSFTGGKVSVTQWFSKPDGDFAC